MKTRDRRREHVARILDVVFATIGLLILFPVLCLIALLAFFDDGWPILFHQTRVGRSGRPFQIWKFRTMRAHSQGMPITAAGDSRITRVGRWLRRFKLDEFPQLFNVLRGEMSFIGPRPEVPEFVRLEDPQWQAVLCVRPGITDLATLVCRDEEQLLGAMSDPAKAYREKILPAKLQLNIEYQHSRTFLQDLRLLILTVRYSFFPAQPDPEQLCRQFRCQDAIYE